MANGSDYKPFISPEERPPELTVTAVVLGVLLAIVFGAANAYLGLIIGMTISASIPASVISMAIIRGLLRRNSILENNIVQTMTTAGEALASGAIFTLPALFLWKVNPDLFRITLVVLTGGFLGVLFMIPLRRMLVVREHGKLPYPEGTACARVLMAGEEGGQRAWLVFKGLGLGAVFKFLEDGLKLFPSEISTGVAGLRQGMVGMDTLPSLMGVGFVIGPRIGGLMAAGGVIAWLILIPMIAYFGQGTGVVPPGSAPLPKLDAWGIWDSYIRYIGAGAVAAGGIISLIRTLPTLWRTLAATAAAARDRSASAADGLLRTEQDIPRRVSIPLAVGILLVIAFLPQLDVGIIGALGVAIVGFLFVTVSARIVGIVGSSSDPVSGMTIATLLIVATTYRAAGYTGMRGMVASLVVGAIICTALAIAGDISQDLKTGFLVGATPRRQQAAMLIGTFASGLTIGWVLVLLNDAYGFGSKDLPAPKAVLMKMIIEGIMNASMPWDLIFIGVAMAVAIELLGVEALPVAVGLYLPVHTSVPVLLGGLVRWWVTRPRKDGNAAHPTDVAERGVLAASGLIAGESLLGILLAILVTVKIPLPANPLAPGWVSLVLFLLLALWLGWTAVRGRSAGASATR
ncbi:OPT family oligopeptide transporter [Alicyclobacillus macrosporangiidus]|uniref:Putative oligopeptide transporter, OPT family n=1 Tax=Alicyclobacillus macrosporangiidus TaxID=392015 RepID=A0A1I7KVD8_9BACL|nr:oligopeptide transporter, OPT family [Alicyclobacillus macrosporangiidus]SFV01264.1 putative oligopeptide transporter, OPT family [Alicyclobacillus macrosporangiidus]